MHNIHTITFSNTEPSAVEHNIHPHTHRYVIHQTLPNKGSRKERNVSRVLALPSSSIGAEGNIVLEVIRER